MMKQTLLNLSAQRDSAWTYASLTVLDGERQLKPCDVASDRIHFREPPRLVSEQVVVVVVNGDFEYRRVVAVLPHDEDATRIPIRLLPAE